MKNGDLFLQHSPTRFENSPKASKNHRGYYGFMGYPWIIHGNSGFWNPALDDLSTERRNGHVRGSDWIGISGWPCFFQAMARTKTN